MPAFTEPRGFASGAIRKPLKINLTALLLFAAL